MDNKISLPQLAKTLSGKLDISQKEAEVFLREFFESVSHNVLIDKVVKIKGFGTFKLIEVQDRESVNVNTGERIVIPGHSKISFTPDVTLKDIVNKPFADFQTVIINDGTNLEDMERMDLVEPLPVQPEEEESEYAENPEVETNDAADRTVTINTEELTVDPIADAEDLTKAAHTEEESELDMDIDQESVTIPEINPAIESSAEPEEPANDTTDTDEGHTSDQTKIEHVASPAYENRWAESTHIPQNPYRREPLTDSQDEGNQNATKDVSIQNTEMNNSESPFMRFLQSLAIALIILLLMGGSYYAGYNHVLCPYASPCHHVIGNATSQDKPNQPIASADSLTDIKVTKDSVIANEIDTNQLSAGDSAMIAADDASSLKIAQEAVAEEETARKDREAEAERLAQEAAAKKAAETASKATTPQYRAGARYRIVGTLKTHKLQYGEYLNRIAYREYGNKEFVRYIVIHNNLENPDNIPIGTVIKLPKLEEIK